LSLLGGFHRASAAACTRLPPPNPLAVGPPGSRLGLRLRELSHFSDNAGCDLSVSTRSPLRVIRTDPDGVPSQSFRARFAHRKRPTVCFHPVGLLTGAPRCASRRPFGRGPTPQALPIALALSLRRVIRRREPDSDCGAFATDDGPSATGSIRQHAGSDIAEPPQATLDGHRSSVDTQTRPVRPTSSCPPLTDVPASRPAALGLGWRLPFCSPLWLTP
jgi:hypothetical protein